MTLHSAKGLEFDTVFMVGMEEGLFPHSNSFTDLEQLAEERRLCYVGITRARKRLFLTHAEKRFVFGRSSSNLASRFLEDIPENILEMTSWNGSYDSDSWSALGTSSSDDGDDFDDGDAARSFDGLDYEPGDVVQHEKFGKGTVIDVLAPYITINFPGQGTKKFSLDFVKLKKVSEY